MTLPSLFTAEKKSGNTRYLYAERKRKLNNTKVSVADEILSKCNELKYSVIAIDDEHYPQKLINIDTPPAVLYVNGQLPELDNRLSVSIVGTRRATRYGTDNSYKFAYALAKYSVVIISGGALGVDCASHRGALSANGITVCVLGCGINYKISYRKRGYEKCNCAKRCGYIRISAR